jgi:hypothetical protein
MIKVGQTELTKRGVLSGGVCAGERGIQVEGRSVRQTAREFGLSRKTVRKMPAFSAQPGYQRKKLVARPKLGPRLEVIARILEDDESQPKKQRDRPAAGPKRLRLATSRRGVTRSCPPVAYMRRTRGSGARRAMGADPGLREERLPRYDQEDPGTVSRLSLRECLGRNRR